MKILEVKSLAIEDVKVIRYGYFFDERGYFTEPFRKSDLLNNIDAGSISGKEIKWSNFPDKNKINLRWIQNS